MGRDAQGMRRWEGYRDRGSVFDEGVARSPEDEASSFGSVLVQQRVALALDHCATCTHS